MIGYTIISIGDDSREEKRQAIRNEMSKIPQCIEVTDIEFCNAYDEDQRKRFSQKDYEFLWTPKMGEFGIWHSTIACWEYLVESDLDALIMFEDDAILHKDFTWMFDVYSNQLPDNWGLFTLFVPHDQHNDYKHYGQMFFETGAPQFQFGANDICRVYQGYGGPANMYSKAGAERLLERLREHKIYTTSDCYIMDQAKQEYNRDIEWCSIKPDCGKMVTVDREAPTTIHHSDIMTLEEANGIFK